MSTSLYERIRTTSTEDLLAMLRFFDSGRLRQYYTGLLDDIRRELGERGALP
jgi:hypothetical protein